MGIGPLKLRARADVRQRLRADLNDHAFGSFDLLFRVQKGRILLQCREDGLIQRKSRHLANRPCSATGPCFTAGACCFTTAKTSRAQNAAGCEDPQENKKSSHTGSAIRCEKTSVRI